MWSSALGYGIFWIGLIASIIIYIFKRKFYPIIYLISISLYIFLVGFVIDVFELSKNGILLMLALSTGVMMGLGVYISKKIKNDKQ